jgi:GNAT superfamily N-acetyltransferase
MRRALGGEFELDDDRSRIDIEAVHAFISEQSYWGQGRARERVQAAIDGSARVVGLYRGREQVGFARAASDCATVAYLSDVYVLEEFRGRGLGVELVRELVDAGPLKDMHWLLHTLDAEPLYERLAFRPGPLRYRLMERPRGYDSRP